MDSNYHIFKKSVKSKGKTVHKWYCYWNDPVTGVMHQKVCKGCKTQAEAYAFAGQTHFKDFKNKYLTKYSI